MEKKTRALCSDENMEDDGYETVEMQPMRQEHYVVMRTWKTEMVMKCGEKDKSTM